MSATRLPSLTTTYPPAGAEDQALALGVVTTVKRGFNEIRDLRDHLAHANYYAETPAAARQVCQVVRKIRRIQADLLTGIEDQ